MKILTFLYKINRFYAIKASFAPPVRNLRNILGDKVTNLNESTLTGRIMTHLNITQPQDVRENSNFEEKTNLQEHPNFKKSLRIDNTSYDIYNNLKASNFKCQRLTVSQIKKLLSLANDRNHINTKEDFVQLIDALNVECALRIYELNTKEIFNLLNLFMQAVPSRLIEYKFYTIAVGKLMGSLDNLTKDEILTLLFYISLGKKNSMAQTASKKCLKNINNSMVDLLTIEDLCVICNSTFKTSTKITNKAILEKVVDIINGNLHLLKDSAFFITLIKTLRHNRFQNEDILSTISCGIIFNKTSNCYSFIGICHILALYADYLYYDESLLNIFAELGVDMLKNENFTDRDLWAPDVIRIKDVKRFLWALSNLGYDLDENVIKNVIVPNITERIKGGEYEGNPDVLLDTVLYLWILNYQALDIIGQVLNKENVRLIREMKSKSKARLNILLSAIRFEAPEFYVRLNIKPTGTYMFNEELQIQNRPTLKRVYEILTTMKNEENSDVTKFLYTCEVPYLNIVGITGFKTNHHKAVFVEVLDDFVCVKNKEHHPIGPMQMKLRILDRFDEAVIKVEEDEADEMTDDELKEYLINELKMLC